VDTRIRYDHSGLHHGPRTRFSGPPGSRPSRVSLFLQFVHLTYVSERYAKHATLARSQYFYHMYLRTLSANETHPQAGSPFLPFLRKSQVTGGIDHVPAYRLRILDNLIGTLAKEVVDDAGGFSAFMEIWNWKHGARGSVSSSLCRPPFLDTLEIRPDLDFHVNKAVHHPAEWNRRLLFPFQDRFPCG